MLKFCVYKNGKGEVVYKKCFNAKGQETYYENSTGYWWKKRYNKQGLQTYFVDSTGCWWKKRYNEQGILIRHESSMGEIITLIE